MNRLPRKLKKQIKKDQDKLFTGTERNKRIYFTLDSGTILRVQ